jgi:hypothetical protein
METQNDQKRTPLRISKIVGYILLIPPLLSVFLFLAQLFSEDKLLQKKFSFTFWVGYIRDVGGHTSALPFYFGLMAIAASYLIRDSNKNNN